MHSSRSFPHDSKDSPKPRTELITVDEYGQRLLHGDG